MIFYTPILPEIFPAGNGIVTTICIVFVNSGIDSGNAIAAFGISWYNAVEKAGVYPAEKSTQKAEKGDVL
jgi:hypothetical protein